MSIRRRKKREIDDDEQRHEKKKKKDRCIYIFLYLIRKRNEKRRAHLIIRQAMHVTRIFMEPPSPKYR